MCFPHVEQEVFSASARVWLELLTCQQAKKVFAAYTVPHQEGVGHAHNFSIFKCNVDALGAKPHLEVAEL